MNLLTVALLLACLCQMSAGIKPSPGFTTATCKMTPNCGAPSCVTGTLIFTQRGSGDTAISGFLQNVQPVGLHGWHVHELGIVDPAEGCNSAGGHFNPDGVTHGAPDAVVRHAGDLGNLASSGPLGLASIQQTDRLVTLMGPSSRSVLGRTVVIHAGPDDLGLGTGAALEGSLATGNSGARIGCCVIEKIF